MLGRIGRPLARLGLRRNMTAGYIGPLDQENGINPNVLDAEYAVRGQLVVRAEGIKKQIASGERSDIDKVIFCNIGNPQSLRQQPLSLVRAVLAAALNPDPKMLSTLPQDAVKRAQDVLDECWSVGAYSNSKGLPGIRRRVADALERRDGTPADPESIFLTNGASQGVSVVLQMLVRGPNDGVLVPSPQYPLYSATMTLLGGRRVQYYLVEEDNWGLEMKELEEQTESARASGTEVRAIVVINPGNPTGQTLTRDTLERIVRFAEKNNLLILADEVYQVNVYDESKPFISFKQVVSELNSPVQLISFHSTSKGVFGECGLRGGFMEVFNMKPATIDQMYKLASISLCSNVLGQVAVDIMMNPPQIGDESFEKYQAETGAIFDSMRRRATMLADALNKFEGVSCQKCEGAMYLFPTITLPLSAVDQARKEGMEPDLFYCMNLLEKTGICVVPGSGFGQKEGTYHFRTTILPPEDEIQQVVEKMGEFHAQFLRQFQ